MIEARICKRFHPARESAPFTLDIRFSADAGITCLFGPSGAGKTLTLDSIAGFVRPDSGRILVNDRILFDAQSGVNTRPQDRRCGYVFQNYALFPHMTLRENLHFAARRTKGIVDRRRRVNEMLERFRLEGVAGRKPHEVSGGQKQRCSIARALVRTPDLLLLDEPARGLDAPLRGELYDILRQVRQEFGTPMLLVTHSLEECFTLADQMLVINDGRLVQEGSPSDVCDRPADLETARLLGIFNVVPVEIVMLDPSQNISILRCGEFRIQSTYYPGHLNGDRVHLLAGPRQLSAAPRNGRQPGPNEVIAVLSRTIEMAGMLRLQFDNGLEVEMPGRDSVQEQHNKEWAIRFPAHGLRIV
jgi:molybdate transport system ATP-binding protein